MIVRGVNVEGSDEVWCPFKSLSALTHRDSHLEHSELEARPLVKYIEFGYRGERVNYPCAK
jgi:hypothetical protein